MSSLSRNLESFPAVEQQQSFIHKLLMRLPFMRWLPQVNQQGLQRDLMAGLTGAVVVLPQGVAFATIAGMPPEYGLYAGMIPAIIAAFFGSSRHLCNALDSTSNDSGIDCSVFIPVGVCNPGHHGLCQPGFNPDFHGRYH